LAFGFRIKFKIEKEWIENIETFLFAFYDRLSRRFANDRTVNLRTANFESSDGRLYLLDNKYFANVAQRREEQQRQNVPTAIGVYPNRYQTVRFQFSWQSTQAEISVELHSEYFTISSALDLSLSENQMQPLT
jgi:hypothetical protein